MGDAAATGTSQGHDARGDAAVLAAWAREHCLHLVGERCQLPGGKGGRCRLRGPEVLGCDWAEHGPILCAPEEVFSAYKRAVPTPFWRRPRRAWPGATVSVSVGSGPRRAARVCRKCQTVELAPRQRVCDACRKAGRRERAASGRHRDDIPPNPYAAIDAACIAAGQVVERLCPRCNERPLLPGRRCCDPCRAAGRRATVRRVVSQWRQKRGASRRA